MTLSPAIFEEAARMIAEGERIHCYSALRLAKRSCGEFEHFKWVYYEFGRGCRWWSSKKMPWGLLTRTLALLFAAEMIDE